MSLRAVLPRLPEVVGGDRRALGDVRAGDEDHLGLRDVAPRVGAAVDAEDLLRGGRGRDHAQPAVVVDVGRPQRDARELAHQVGLLVGQRGAGQDGEGVAAVRRLDPLDLAGRPIQRGVPVNCRKASSFVARQRRAQAIRMLVLHVALHALGAELALVERELFPRLEADDLFVLDLELDAALLAAEAAVRLHDPVRFAVGRPSRPRGRGWDADRTAATSAGSDVGSCAIRHLGSRGHPGSARGSCAGTADRRPGSGRACPLSRVRPCPARRSRMRSRARARPA